MIRSILERAGIKKLLPSYRIWIRRKGRDEFRTSSYSLDSFLHKMYHDECEIFIGPDRPNPPAGPKPNFILIPPELPILTHDVPASQPAPPQTEPKKPKRKANIVERRKKVIEEFRRRKRRARMHNQTSHDKNKKPDN